MASQGILLPQASCPRRFRRASPWLVGTATATITLLGLLLPRSSPAQPPETTTTQTNSGTVTLWEPIIADFYMKTEQTQVHAGPEMSTAPTFEDGLITPLPKFSLVEPPADSLPSLLADWSVLQSRMDNREPVSAWLVSSDGRRPRIYAHRVFDESVLVGYPERARLRIVLRLDVPEERLPIPDNPAGDARRDKLLANTRIVRSVLTISRLSGVTANAGGGTTVSGSEERPPVSATNLSQPITIDYIPRYASTKAADGTFNDVINLSLECELEVGKELGINPPERKTVKGEIRAAVGAMRVGIDVLERDSRKK